MEFWNVYTLVLIIIVNQHNMTENRYIKRIVLSFPVLIIIFALIRVLLPFSIDSLRQYPASTVIYDREGGVLRVTLGDGDLLCRPIGLEESGDWVGRAALAAEDKRFFRHPGVDPIAIIRALGQNLISGRIVSGASTISTLVVKLTRGPRARNIFTKCVEAFRAIQMERVFSKGEILQQYLNRAPFGSNLTGIAAAAHRYFGKAARDLTLSEAALLLGLPQTPSRLRPDRHPEAARIRRDRILERMLADGSITKVEKETARAQPVRAGIHPLPFRAPHFCDLILKKYRPGGGALRTTLDPALQTMIEDLLEKEARERLQRGISGGAVVVIQVPTGEVRALVGSPDYNGSVSGQVNCAAARRSPGSALKPFIYARAIDRGCCTPDTILADVPVAWADYRPENFERQFLGLVTVREALVRSLNIPAITLARRLGVQELLRLFRRAGLTTLDKPASHYGLGIAIGDGEVTLLDLTNSYACLARGGEFMPYQVLLGERIPPRHRLFSEEAAFLVTGILGGEERLSALMGQTSNTLRPRFAWKTGPSNGYRDAWAIGYTPAYSIGVWLGNPGGAPSPSLVGIEAAAPLLCELFRGLYPKGDAPRPLPPPGLKRRMVCAVTGLPPTRCCPAVTEAYHIPGISPSKRCAVHRSARREGEGDGGDRVVEVWPPEIAEFLEREDRQKITASGDEAAAGKKRPAKIRIVSPLNGETFYRMGGERIARQQIPLEASGGDGSEMYWFVNGLSLGRTRAGERLFWEIEEGEWSIACGDARGKGDRVRITVK